MFIGNQKIVQLLDRSLKNGRIAQAYLFAGPESVGKFLLARLFAHSLIFEKDLIELKENFVFGELERSEAKILDLMIIKPHKEEKKNMTKEKDIGVEEIRKSLNFLITYPIQGKFKVLIINEAHYLTESAQNALLKFLEEPNSTAVIILVTHWASKILPTLKSRSRLVNFGLVNEDQIRKSFSDKRFAEDLARAAKLSLGRPGIFLEIMKDKEKIQEWEKRLGIVEQLKDMNINERLQIAEEMNKNLPQAVQTLNLWTCYLHQNAFKEEDFRCWRRIAKIEESISYLVGTKASSRAVLENLFLNWD